jgi:hypothetical protein
MDGEARTGAAISRQKTVHAKPANNFTVYLSVENPRNAISNHIITRNGGAMPPGL